MTKKKTVQGKNTKTQESYPTTEPKRLSKLGEWRRANPQGLEGTFDMRAVMR